MKVRKFRLEPDDSLRSTTSDLLEAWLMSYCLLIPDSERFIVKTCSRFRSPDKKLTEDMRTCFAQEIQHALSHEEYVRQIIVRAKAVRGVVLMSRIVNYKMMTPLFPLHLRLAVAAAMEQLNAAIALYGLETKSISQSDNRFYQMLKWHFLEELEHREVVFDVMNASRIGSVTKFAAISLVLWSFLIWITVGSLFLLRPSFNRSYMGSGFRSVCDIFFRPQGLAAQMAAASWRFLKRTYHPSQDPLPQALPHLQQQYKALEIR